jgi:AcrR family transcriptional regulator
VPRKRATPGLDRPLTPDQVIEAGLNLLDEVGIPSFSTRALAERLGTYPATLYWHVGNRSRLLAAIVDRALSELELLEEEPRNQLISNGPSSRTRIIKPTLEPLTFAELITEIQ